MCHDFGASIMHSTWKHLLCPFWPSFYISESLTAARFYGSYLYAHLFAFAALLVL